MYRSCFCYNKSVNDDDFGYPVHVILGGVRRAKWSLVKR